MFRAAALSLADVAFIDQLIAVFRVDELRRLIYKYETYFIHFYLYSPVQTDTRVRGKYFVLTSKQSDTVNIKVSKKTRLFCCNGPPDRVW